MSWMKSYKVDFDPTHTGYLQTQLWHISILQLAESPPHPGPGKRECTAFVLLTMNHPSPPLHLLLFVLFPCSRCFNESLSLLCFEALSQAINIQQKLIKKVAFVHRRSFQNNAHQHSKSTFFNFLKQFSIMWHFVCTCRCSNFTRRHCALSALAFICGKDGPHLTHSENWNHSRVPTIPIKVHQKVRVASVSPVEKKCLMLTVISDFSFHFVAHIALLP